MTCKLLDTIFYPNLYLNITRTTKMEILALVEKPSNFFIDLPN